jgi:lipoprotein-releasing system permease protein
MLGRGEDLRAAMIRGIEPQFEPQVSEIGGHMNAGRLDDLQPGERHIVLGAGLAYALDARVGDEITVLVPVSSGKAGEGAIAGIDLQPRIQTFTVSGVFEVGAQEHDNVLAFVSLQDAAAIVGNGGVPGGLRLKFTDIFAAPDRVQADCGVARAPTCRRAIGRSRTPATSARSASRRR